MPLLPPGWLQRCSFCRFACTCSFFVGSYRHVPSCPGRQPTKRCAACVHSFLFPGNARSSVFWRGSRKADVIFFCCCYVCTVDKGNIVQCQAFIGLSAEPCLPRQVRTKATIAKTLPHACQEISCAEFSGSEISLRRCSRGRKKKSFWDSMRAKCTKERCG